MYKFLIFEIMASFQKLNLIFFNINKRNSAEFWPLPRIIKFLKKMNLIAHLFYVYTFPNFDTLNSIL